MLSIKRKMLIVPLLIGVLLFFNISVSAQGYIDGRSMKITSSIPGDTNVEYTFEYSLANAYTVGSIVLEFCENTPLLGFPCDPIPGFSAASSSIVNETGISGFSVAAGATDSRIVLTRAASLEGPTAATVVLDGINNPSDEGTNFARAQIFSSIDGTGVALLEGGMTFAMNEPVELEVYVPPHLTFCVAVSIPGFDCSGANGGLFIDMGELAPSYTSTATSQFIGQTNADNGFVVSISGTPPTSGSNVINQMNSLGASNIGSSQFGINLRNNSNPNVGANPAGAGTGNPSPNYNVVNRYKYTSGDAIYSTSTTTLGNKNTVSYIINVSPNQNPGVYNTTLIFTALASF